MLMVANNSACQQPGDIPVDLQPGVAPVPFKYNLPAAVAQADLHDGIQGLIDTLAHIMAGGAVNQPALSLETCSSRR